MLRPSTRRIMLRVSVISIGLLSAPMLTSSVHACTAVYRRVLHDELSFESAEEEFDPNTRTLLRGMLQRDPLLRITIPRLKRMPYFDLISWDLILTQRYMPPFVPQLDPLNPADLSWFDDAYLSMPAEIKGEDPEDEPGGGREAPAGDAQPALDDSGRDVFDGCTLGHDLAAIVRTLIAPFACRFLLRPRFCVHPRRRCRSLRRLLYAAAGGTGQPV